DITPLGFRCAGSQVAISGQTVLESVPAVGNYVFRNTSQLKDEFTPRNVWRCRRSHAIVDNSIGTGDEGIQQPEFNVFNVRLVEVYFRAHSVGDRPEILPRVVEQPEIIQIRIKVVWPSLCRIISHVEYGLVGLRLLWVAMRKDFLRVHSALIVIGDVLEARRPGHAATTSAPIEQVVDHIPR